MVHIFRSLPYVADARISRFDLLFNNNDTQIYTWEKSFTKNKAIKNVVSFPIKKDLIFRFQKAIAFLLYELWLTFKVLQNVKNGDICIFMDLETIFLGYFATRLKKATIVFDIVDPISQTKVKNKKMGLIADKVEVWYARRSDLITIPHTCRADYYHEYINEKIPVEKMLVIENVPLLDLGKKPVLNIDIPQDKIIIGFFGSLDNVTRGLEWLINFSQVYKNEIFLIIGGQGKLEKYLKDSKFENVKFIGPFSQEMLPSLYDNIDFTWAYYSPLVELHRYAAPNKFYEHLFFGKPIITSDIIPQSNFIQYNHTGLFVNCETENTYEKFYRDLITYLGGRRVDIKQLWNENYANYYQKIEKKLDQYIKKFN